MKIKAVVYFWLVGLLGGGVTSTLWAQDAEPATTGAVPDVTAAPPRSTAEPTPKASAPEALAVTAEAASEPKRSANRVIEEIVVTAQKREEAIQSVPISIAAFSADALDARGAFDTKALASITPGLTITEFGGFSFYYIRGVGGDAFVPSADPSVTTYVDGIFVPTSQGFSTDFGGIERVEVLKGPQGTLFGRNSTGGAINVITKKPGGPFEGSLEGTYGNYNDRRIKGYVNVPVTDSIAFSLDGIIKNYDSQYSNPNREIMGQANREGRAKLNWQALDDLSITGAIDFSRQRSSGSSVSKNIRPSPCLPPWRAVRSRTTTSPRRIFPASRWATPERSQ